MLRRLLRHTMADLIWQRSEQVRSSGTYVGLFEFLVLTEWKNVRVLALFGKNVLDVRRHLGGCWPEAAPTATIYTVAARLTMSGTSLAVSDCAADVNHWLIAVSPFAIDVESVLPGESDVLPPGTTAAAAAESIGWYVKPTNATGECGIDVMAYGLGCGRGPSQWQEIREGLADFMVTMAEHKEWQDAFSLCGEASAPMAAPAVLPPAPNAAPAPAVEPAVAVEPARSSTDGVPSPVDSAASPVEEPSTLALVEGTPAPQSNPTPPSVAPQPSSPPPLPPPKLPPPGDTSAPALVDGTSPPPAGFQEYLRTLDAERLAAITSDYFSFRAAQDDWNAKHPKCKLKAPLRKGQQRATPVSYRLAVGMRFLQWLEMCGATTRSPLKVCIAGSAGHQF